MTLKGAFASVVPGDDRRRGTGVTESHAAVYHGLSVGRDQRPR